jgi:tartrate dehydratase alpha subunit/fumarate hydratase class I-like protein
MEGCVRGTGKGPFGHHLLIPWSEKNFGDNTPAIIHVEIVPDDNLRLIVIPKGFGGENMSRVALLTPASGMEGITEFVLWTVEEAGPIPCPPGIVSVGIGGTYQRLSHGSLRPDTFSRGSKKHDWQRRKTSGGHRGDKEAQGNLIRSDRRGRRPYIQVHQED